MPIYLYSCPRCGMRLEITKPIKELAKRVDCPKCKKEAIRTPAVTNFILKGNNWSGKRGK